MEPKLLHRPTRGLLGCRALLLAVPILFVSCTRAPIAVPSRITRNSQELNNPLLAASGIYPDGWISRSGSLQLWQPPGNTVLRVRAMVPLTNNSGFHTAVELRIDDVPLVRHKLDLGSFDVSLQVPAGVPKRRITVAFDQTQVLPGRDGRQVGARLESVGFEKPDTTTVRAAAEIVEDPQVHLDAGWDALETFDGETFRWVENDAKIMLNLGAARDAVLTLLLAPGPGAGGQPLLVRILDASGRQAGAILLDRRRTFQVPLPLQPGAVTVFTLHVDGGGMRVPSDSRILNFRAFDVEAGPWPAAR